MQDAGPDRPVFPIVYLVSSIQHPDRQPEIDSGSFQEFQVCSQLGQKYCARRVYVIGSRTIIVRMRSL